MRPRQIWRIRSRLPTHRSAPAAPGQGVSAALRCVQPLVELRADFELARAELDAIDRGARAVEVDVVRKAAGELGTSEAGIIFHGYADAGIQGICEAANTTALSLTRDYQKYPLVVSEALARLRRAGVAGPTPSRSDRTATEASPAPPAREATRCWSMCAS